MNWHPSHLHSALSLPFTASPPSLPFPSPPIPSPSLPFPPLPPPSPPLPSPPYPTLPSLPFPPLPSSPLPSPLQDYFIHCYHILVQYREIHNPTPEDSGYV